NGPIWHVLAPERGGSEACRSSGWHPSRAAPGQSRSALNGAALQHNAFLLTYCRTALAAVSGCTAGILGLTGLLGFAFYMLASGYLSCLLLAKAGRARWRYFPSAWALASSGVMGELITYITFWTFLYGMVHVY
ncbi:hypothetical protein BOX15_Mlig006946g3, partial [Macrostomum lignano]